MQKQHLVLGLLAKLLMDAHAADAPAPTCEQMREGIMAANGSVAMSHTDLLQRKNFPA